MVTSTAHFRVIAPAGTRISVGTPETPGGPGQGAFNLPGIFANLFPGYQPIQFPTPGTGGTSTGGTQDDIVNPNPNGTCPTGYTLTNGLCVQTPQTSCPAGQLLLQGVCIPITSLPQCQTGYARNLTTGVCELVTPTPTPGLPNPPPVAGAVSIITEVLVPARVVPSQSFTITLKFKNLSSNAEKFASRVVISATGLSVDLFSSLFEVAAGANGAIQSTVTLPSATPVATYPSTITLYRRIITGQVVFEDLDNFNLFVDQATPFPGDVEPPGPNTALFVATPVTFVKNTMAALSIAGTLFRASEVVNVKWVENGATLKQTSITATAAGTLTDTTTLPGSNDANNVVVTGTGNMGSTASVTITAVTGTTTTPPPTTTCPASDPALNLTKTVRGTRIYDIKFKISGLGYTPGETLSIRFYNNEGSVNLVTNHAKVPTTTSSHYASYNSRYRRAYTGSSSTSSSYITTTVTIPTGITCVKINIVGLTSNKTMRGYFVPT